MGSGGVDCRDRDGEEDARVGRQGDDGHRLREAWAEVRRAEAARSSSWPGQKQLGEHRPAPLAPVP